MKPERGLPFGGNVSSRESLVEGYVQPWNPLLKGMSNRFAVHFHGSWKEKEQNAVAVYP